MVEFWLKLFLVQSILTIIWILFSKNCERSFLMTIVLLMVNTWLCLFSPYFRKFLQGIQFWNLGFLLRYVQKNVELIMKLLSNITPNQSRLGVHHAYFFPRFEPTNFLLVAVFFFDGSLGFTTRFLSYYIFLHRK